MSDVRELLGCVLAGSGLMAAAIAEDPIIVFVGGLLWVSLPTYWLAKNVGGFTPIRGRDDPTEVLEE